MTLETPSASPMPTFAVAHPMNIVVCEDNLMNQRMLVRYERTHVSSLMCRMLQSLGYSENQIKVANNGQECIELLTDQMSDCVLMDVQVGVARRRGFDSVRCPYWMEFKRRLKSVRSGKARNHLSSL